MNIKQLIESRYSVRSFLDKDVGFEKVKSILDTANSAPSGGNIQPWKVYVLGNNSKNELEERVCILLLSLLKKYEKEKAISGNRTNPVKLSDL